MGDRESNASAQSYAVLDWYKHLRVVDVCDAMDGMGYFDIGLLDPDIRLLWLGMK